MSTSDLPNPNPRRRRERLPRPNAGPDPDAPGAAAAEGADFYAEQLNAEDRPRFERALRITGLAAEIALLRLRIANNVRNPETVQDSVALLVRAVAAQYRLSQQHQDELYQSVLNVVQGLGEVAGLPVAGES